MLMINFIGAELWLSSKLQFMARPGLATQIERRSSRHCLLPFQTDVKSFCILCRQL